MRLTTKPVTAEAEAWDPGNPGPFERMAGGQFLGCDGDVAMVRDLDGCIRHLHPGSLVILADGAAPGAVTFAGPSAVGTGPQCPWTVAG